MRTTTSAWRTALTLAALIGLAGCGSSGHDSAAGRSASGSPTQSSATQASPPASARTSDASSLSPAQLKSQAADAADVCAAWHDFYRYMTADPVAYHLASQSMLTMSVHSLGISEGNAQFPTLRDDVEELLEASAANPLEPINPDTPGVAGLQRECR